MQQNAEADAARKSDEESGSRPQQRGARCAEDERQVRRIASLAAGSDSDLVCQAYLGPETVDYRLYFVDGRVHTTMRRTPARGEVAANTMRGGRAEYVEAPPQLSDAAEYLATKFTIPYFCADFLFDGHDFHLSEVELDGAYAPDHTGRTTGLLEARFTAYARHHELFVGQVG